MTEQHLHDAHLKKALEHAPDADVQASTQVRNAVLDYARKSTKPKRSWLAIFKNWLIKDHFSNAQWAGLTGLTAVLLVTVLLLREHPEDAIWTADNPATIPESSPATAEFKTQSNGAIQQDAPAKLNNQTAPAAEETLSTSADSLTTTQSSSLPEKNRQASNAEPEAKKLDRDIHKDAQLKESTASSPIATMDTVGLAKSADKSLEITTDEKKVTAKNSPKEIAIADAPIVASPAPAAAPMEATAQSMPATDAADKAMSKPKAASRELTSNKAEESVRDTVEGAKAANEADDSTHIQNKERRQKLNENLSTNADIAKMIVLNGGQAMAKSDINAGNYHLFKVITHDKTDAHDRDCVAQKTLTESTDAQSGLPIKNIDVCAASAQLVKEVEIYNKTVLDWFLQYRGE